MFKDESKGLYIKIIEAEIISTWRSLIKLDPQIKEVRLNYPTVRLKSNKEIVGDLKVFVRNNENDNDLNLKKFFSSFQNLKIKNGKVEFEPNKKKHVFENIDLGIKSTDYTELKADINYKNIKSFIKLDAKTKKFQRF